MAVVTSASKVPVVWVLLLLAGLVSATLGAVTAAVTVAPAAVMVTVTATDWVAPGARVTAPCGTLTPLTRITGVKVTVVEPLLLRVTVAVTVEPGVPAGIGLTRTAGSA